MVVARNPVSSLRRGLAPTLTVLFPTKELLVLAGPEAGLGLERKLGPAPPPCLPLSPPRPHLPQSFISLQTA